MTLQQHIDAYINRHRKTEYSEADMRLIALFIGTLKQE